MDPKPFHRRPVVGTFPRSGGLESKCRRVRLLCVRKCARHIRLWAVALYAVGRVAASRRRKKNGASLERRRVARTRVARAMRSWVKTKQTLRALKEGDFAEKRTKRTQLAVTGGSRDLVEVAAHHYDGRDHSPLCVVGPQDGLPESGVYERGVDGRSLRGSPPRCVSRACGWWEKESTLS